MTTTDTIAGVLPALADPTPQVREALAQRAETVQWQESAYAELFDPAARSATVGTLPTGARHAVAARVAGLLGSEVLATHHRAVTGTADAAPAGVDDTAWAAVLAFADVQALTPALVTSADVDGLLAHLVPDDVVVLSQVVAFTTFAARYVAGLELLSGRAPVGSESTPDVASAGRHKSRATETGNGLERPIEYTRDLLSWTPWVPPVAEDELTDEQREAFAGKTNGEYFRLLARLPKVLHARTRLDASVFATRDGLPRAERELAAAVVSKVNDCIYCASVHARKSAQMSGRPDDVDRVLAAELPRDALWRPTDLSPLAEGQDERWSAVVTFAADLARRPWALGPDAVSPLRDLGLTDVELLDLVGSVAFFSWANRLMLTLGEPYRPTTDRETPR